MTITFACSCGRQLAAADENAGKRVRCGACGGIQTVPNAEPPPRWIDEPPAMIRFACTTCGQTCQARPEHAGRKTRCPGCDRVLTIPGDGDEGEEVVSRRSDALQADRPLPRPAGRRRRLEEDDWDEDEDDRPRRRSIKKKSRKWLWLSLSAAVLVLAGGGLALWLILRSGTSGDFDLVPRDAQGFVTYRVAGLLKTPLGKKAMDRLQPQLAAPLRQLEEKTGLGLTDIERVTAVFVDIKDEVFWIIVQTNKSLDKDKILKLAENPAEQKHKGKKYYHRDKFAFTFVSNRLVVFGSEKGIQRCLELPKKPASGPLDDALQAASKSNVQFAMAGNVPPELMRGFKATLEQLPGDARKYVQMFAVLFDIRTVHMTAAVADDIDCEVVVAFPDSDKAKKGEEVLNQALGMLRVALPFARAAFQQQGMGQQEVDEAIAKAQKMLEQMKPKQSGKTVRLAWKESGSDALKQIEGLNKMFNMMPFGGGFGRPPAPGFGPPPGIQPPGGRPFPGRRGRRR